MVSLFSFLFESGEGLKTLGVDRTWLSLRDRRVAFQSSHFFGLMDDLQNEIISPELDILAGIVSPLVSVAHFQPTSRPIEDRYSVHLDETRNRLILGVYDGLSRLSRSRCFLISSLGHGGCETAEYISKTLPPRLLQHPPVSHSDIFLNLDQSIVSDFMTDHSIFRKKSHDWIHHARLMKAGCTALVLDVDLNNLTSHYANAGDSRLMICSILNRQILFQTDDLNAKTASEKERLSREHPNEDSLFIEGRLFGRLMCTRGEHLSSADYIVLK